MQNKQNLNDNLKQPINSKNRDVEQNEIGTELVKSSKAISDITKQKNTIEEIRNDLRKGKKLGREEAIQLVESGNIDPLLWYIRQFNNIEGILSKEKTLSLLDAPGETSTEIARNIYMCSSLDDEVAQKLLSKARSLYPRLWSSEYHKYDPYLIGLINYLDKFSELSKETALNILSFVDNNFTDGKFILFGDSVIKHLDKFSGLDLDVLQALVTAGEFRYVKRHLNKFKGLPDSFDINTLGTNFSSEQIMSALESHWVLGIHEAETLFNDPDYGIETIEKYRKQFENYETIKAILTEEDDDE